MTKAELLDQDETLEAERNQMAAFVAFVFSDLPLGSFDRAVRDFNELEDDVIFAQSMMDDLTKKGERR